MITANEGTAVALAAGYHLATGELPVVYLQNSGVGNVVNPLLSLARSGGLRDPDPRSSSAGAASRASRTSRSTSRRAASCEALLSTLGLDYDVLDAATADPAGLLARIRAHMSETGRSHALLVRKGTFAVQSARRATRCG